MAKLCSPLSTSPRSSFLDDLMTRPSCFLDELCIIPDPLEVFGELPSICSDIQKMEDDTNNCSGGSFDWYDDFDMKRVMNIKPDSDLMWPVLSSSVGSTDLAVPLSAVTGNNIMPGAVVIKQEPSSPRANVISTKTENIKCEVKSEPVDDYEQIQYNKMVANNRNGQLQGQLQQLAASMNNIPPGTSLLRKSNNGQSQQRKLLATQQQQQQQQLVVTRHPTPTTKRDHLLSCAPILIHQNSTTTPNVYQRPDTPHSLDDDCSAAVVAAANVITNIATTEFKHDIDLSACVMGSNNISLAESQYIQQVSQELRDTTKQKIGLRTLTDYSLNEVLDVINTEVTTTTTTTTATATTTQRNSSSSCSNYSNSSSSSSSCSSNSSNGRHTNTHGLIIKRCNANIMLSSKATTTNTTTTTITNNLLTPLRTSECDTDDDDSIAGSSTSSILDALSSPISNASPSNLVTGSTNSVQQQQQRHHHQHMDHSYTRVDDLSTNLETPSDSEEEIDVVSINDRKLPTNPSDKDRRALQTKVAHKFNSRIVRGANGIRTIPPRRRGSYELPYTPVSSSPVKSVNNSRYPSPASTPYQSQYTRKYVQQQQQLMTLVMGNSLNNTPTSVLSEKPRKRLLVNGTPIISNGSEFNNVLMISENGSGMNNNKKYRTKKTSKHILAGVTANGTLKRHYMTDETADTIEKRNLHNDMERQRRIGLKNLFEALKKQIPSIRDKERAPKVNILREAAKLCEDLTCEEDRLNEEKARLHGELRKRQERLNQLRAETQGAVIMESD